MSVLGNINSCLHPKRIYNKYTGETLYVPCRKCFRCRDTYSSHWASRIEKECTQHRFSLFVTLTLDNDHMALYEPLIMDDGTCQVWYSNRTCDSGKFLPADSCRSLSPVGMEDTACFAYPCKKDIQNWLKRLRSAIDYQLNKDKSDDFRLRYFICAEYGPTTFRPHYHAILWYDNPVIQQHIDRLIRETWKNGNTVVSLVNNSASQYVAKYVNGDTRLPTFLRTEFTRTFHLASKHPYIGYSEADEDALRDNVLNGTYGHTELNRSTSALEFVSPPRSLENRLLPKCRGYRTLSYTERVRVYSLAYDYKQRGIDFRSLLPFEFNYSAYPSVDIHSTLVCLDWCERFGMTPEIFVRLLDDYYYRKDMYMLRTQYEYQQAYVNDLGMPVHHLVDFDLQLFTYLPRRFSEFELSPWKDVMLSYGIHGWMLYNHDGFLDGELVELFGQRHSSYYEDNVARYVKIHRDSLKTKKLNEQLNARIFY
ncbi:MAG: rolling circle replication-associated protein [Prevotella fusca]